MAALTPTARPATTLAIIRRSNLSGRPGVQPVPMEPLDRRGWRYAKTPGSEALISESLVGVTFESERKCRVATGRWYAAFTGIYVEAPRSVALSPCAPDRSEQSEGPPDQDLNLPGLNVDPGLRSYRAASWAVSSPSSWFRGTLALLKARRRASEPMPNVLLLQTTAAS